MPSCYAHYRFGQQVMQYLPPDAAKAVQHCPKLFRIGLHGPDFFFYFNPLFPTKTGALGKTYHHQSGVEFFTAAAKVWQNSRTEGAASYLYGVLAHYALDATTHPFIIEADADHSALESEFDRYLLVKDGKTVNEDLSKYLKLSRGGCGTVAEFYPPLSAMAVGMSLRHMRWIHHIIACWNRERLRKAARTFQPKLLVYILPDEPDPVCSPYDEALYARVEEAQILFQTLAPQLEALLKENTPLGADFARDFSGE